jgi:hypothetical protein
MSSIHHHICRGLSLFVTLTGEDYRLLSLLFSSAHNALHGARVQEQPSAQARLDGVHLMALQVTSAGPTTCAVIPTAAEESVLLGPRQAQLGMT